MSPPTRTLAELTEAELRSAVGAMERRVKELGALQASSQQLDDLTRSWKELVALLNLGSEPQWRDCPWCRGAVQRLATRCVHCWKKLSPTQ